MALAQNPEGVRFADLLASDREVRRAGPLPDVPIRVLVHGISFDPGGQPVPRLEKVWRELAAELAGPGGSVIVAAKSHHRIAEDEPDVVVQAVRDVLAEAAAELGRAERASRRGHSGRRGEHDQQRRAQQQRHGRGGDAGQPRVDHQRAAVAERLAHDQRGEQAGSEQRHHERERARQRRGRRTRPGRRP